MYSKLHQIPLVIKWNESSSYQFEILKNKNKYESLENILLEILKDKEA